MPALCRNSHNISDLCLTILDCGQLVQSLPMCSCTVLLQMDQFFFMGDRHDANFCCVRYITNIQLREWKRYLQPLANRKSFSSSTTISSGRPFMLPPSQASIKGTSPAVQQRHSVPCATSSPATVQEQNLAATTQWVSILHCAGYMSKVPEEAMGNLQKCLNVAQSPVYSAEFEQMYRQELRSSSSSRTSSNGSSRASSNGGTGSSRSGTASSSRNGTAKGPAGGWLRDLFSSAKKEGSTADGSSAAEGAGVVVLDPMGYYTLLGLKPGNQVSRVCGWPWVLSVCVRVKGQHV